jgi:hypothetical protein
VAFFVIYIEQQSKIVYGLPPWMVTLSKKWVGSLGHPRDREENCVENLWWFQTNHCIEHF